MINPYTGKVRVEYLNAPRVLIPEVVARDMLAITHAIDTEVAWFGTVRRHSEFSFEITEIFLPHQQVNHGTTETQPEHLAALAEELLAGPDGEEQYNALRFWGHSHHTMGVSPSSQDNLTLRALVKSVGEAFISCRTNKRNQIEIDVGYPNGWTFWDVPYEITNAAVVDDRWSALIKERVHPIRHTTPVVYQGGYGQTHAPGRSFGDFGSTPKGKGSGKEGGVDVVGGDTDPERWGTVIADPTNNRLPPNVRDWLTDEKKMEVRSKDGKAIIHPQAYARYAPLAFSNDSGRFMDWKGTTRPLDQMTPIEALLCIENIDDTHSLGEDLDYTDELEQEELTEGLMTEREAEILRSYGMEDDDDLVGSNIWTDAGLLPDVKGGTS